jgi:2-polyprenyl-6-methoxyphenol hydroxylase-like FAD-dependent oxidoreductase
MQSGTANDMRVIIIGAGIGGLTAALSLHKAGLRPTVYEAATALAPLGVGINLLPHATRELTELGLMENLRAIGVEIDELVYLNKWGRRLWREPRGLAAGYRWPQIAIHRGELQMMLAHMVTQRLGPDAIRMGHALERFESRCDGVTAHFIDRRAGTAAGSARADVMIGADGIHSVVRRAFYPSEGAPKWRGGLLYRATTVSRVKLLGGRSMLWAGYASRKFVAYPIRYNPQTGESLINWICDLNHGPDEIPAPPREDWSRIGNRADFLPAFRRWKWPDADVEAIIDGAGDVFEFPMVDRDPLPRWTFGRTTLLGDAAHPMYPIGSNGATQAIIDARVLAFHLGGSAAIDEALASYETARRPATARIVEMNRANGPDQVLELAEQRAPNRDDDLDRLLPEAERSKIADDYKKVAGFDPAGLNARASFDPPS